MSCDTKFTMGWPPRTTVPFWLTIGNFDGVHLGHQALLHEVSAHAQRQNAKSMLVNFWPHPKVYFSKEQGFYLTTRAEKTRLLSGLGIDEVVTLPFDADMANSSAVEFLNALKRHVNVQGMIVGENFAFGKNRQGSSDVLKKFGEEAGFQVQFFPAFLMEGEPVSSTRVREALNDGNVAEARRLLGRPYAMCSKVIYGERVGKSLGVPTANLKVDPEKFLPRLGVYATIAHLRDQDYRAVTCVGVRPTFGDHFKVSVETHILDFNDTIYGEDLQIRFMRWLRQEKKFDSMQALLAQIEEDKTVTRRIFENGFE